MKKVICGKLYSTDTAMLVGEFQYSKPRDFEYLWEGLYRKKTGEYFLAGKGGPNSCYAEPVGTNEWSGGESIAPMSVSEAKEWTEKHLDADTYIAEFGEPEE